MTVLIAFLIAFVVLFGVLALPYSLALTAGAWILGGGLFLVMIVRRRLARQRITLVGGVAIFGVLGLAGWNFGLMPWANQEVVSQVTRHNAGGTSGSAFVVYHPGRSDLQTRTVNGFVEGLVQAGWAVDVTTASAQTPVDMSAYDLLVLGAQAYTWSPARPVQDYLARVGDLNGLPVVALLSGLGETGPANTVMRDLITASNGTLLDIYNVWQLRPIDDLYGTDDPFEAMRQTALNVQPQGGGAP
jgi:hypothetical protein